MRIFKDKITNKKATDPLDQLIFEVDYA